MKPEAQMATAILLSVIERTCQRLAPSMSDAAAKYLASQVAFDLAQEGFDWTLSDYDV